MNTAVRCFRTALSFPLHWGSSKVHSHILHRLYKINCVFFCYQTDQNNYTLFQKNYGREIKLEVYSDIKLEAIIVSVLMLGLIEKCILSDYDYYEEKIYLSSF